MMLFLSIMPLALAVSTASGAQERPMFIGRWEGTFHQFSHDHEGDYDVVVEVSSANGSEFSGTMHWPEFGGTVTEIRGHSDGPKIKWTETKYLRGDDVVLYGLYVGSVLDDQTLEGTWFDPSETIFPAGPNYGVAGGTFSLRAVSPAHDQ